MYIIYTLIKKQFKFILNCIEMFELLETDLKSSLELMYELEWLRGVACSSSEICISTVNSIILWGTNVHG